MKQIIIGIIVAICLTMGFTTGGLDKFKSTGSALAVTIDKVSAFEVNSKSIEPGETPVQDSSIYSWPTILFLSAAVIGIAVFRQNTYE